RSYYWRVRAYNSNGSGSWSAKRKFYVDTVAPAAPKLRSPGDGKTKAGTPTFKWYARSGEKYYQFAYGLTNNPGAAVYTSGWTTLLYHKPPTMDADTTYYWFVQAKDKAGNVGSWSVGREITVTPGKPKQVVLDSPPNAYKTDDSSFDLSWHAVPYGYTYQIQIDNSHYFTSVNYSYTSAVEATSHTVGPLAEGKWYWRVRAVNKDNVKGAWSTYRKFNTYNRFNTQFNSDGNFEGWEAHPGASWSVGSGSLYTKGLSDWYTSSASYSTANFKDFNYTANVKMDAPEYGGFNAHGLVLRGTPTFDYYNDWENGYYFVIGQENYYGYGYAYYNVLKITNGSWKSITPGGYWYNYEFINYNDYNELSVYMKGNTLRFNINGYNVLNKTVSSGPTGGRLGVYQYNSGDEGARMDVDWAVAGKPEVVYTNVKEVSPDSVIRTLDESELGDLSHRH
ncbi:MAG: hypothetical protein J7L66_03030, partial [Anaerolineaceae bacterium]|nr:hypothetical protein [Anaerolineaceae bacterium]